MKPDSSTEAPLYLTEEEWSFLLKDIHDGKVLPVIGPELVTVPNINGDLIPLYEFLAVSLAEKLGIELASDQQTELNAVACNALLQGYPNWKLYHKITDIVDNLTVPLPQGLIDLASIYDFNLYITTTFDPLMVRVLEEYRPGFNNNNEYVSKFSPEEPNDLPDKMPQPFLYHILGDRNSLPHFAIWEEDYIDYLHGLIKAEGLSQLRLLFSKLRNMDLLLMGSPFNDWVVRFFLRVAKGKRFIDQRANGRIDYLAQDPSISPTPTIFFYESQLGSTRIIPGHPSAFASELAKQWRSRYGSTIGSEFMKRMKGHLPLGAVFISYASEDKDAAIELAHGLHNYGIPIWLDKERLNGGENFNIALEAAVKQDASFFISIISSITENEKNSERYFHKERRWAAPRHMDGRPFYIGVCIETITDVKCEPPEVVKSYHREYLPGGKVTIKFVEYMKTLFQQKSQS